MRITLVLGTRPQIVKSSSLIHKISRCKDIRMEIIHTGQHYDYEMTKIFFEELGLPDPAENLDVGSGTHAQQTAEIMMRLEKIVLKEKPELVVVPGDTNSTLAGALTAAKLNVPVAHIEAGARSYDMRMPEEVNRRLTDHISTLLFTPTENCTRNLEKEGITKDRIYQTGDTMYDVLLQQLPKAEKTDILRQLSLKPDSYVLITAHRPENVDNPENLGNIVDAVARLNQLTVVFPVHPRTRKQLKTFALNGKIKRQKHLRLVNPLGYHETLNLVKNARFILTDSGGMQKEAFWLRTPCITLRTNTEWVETVQLGANYLTGTGPEKIVAKAEEIMEQVEKIKERLQSLPNPFGDGRASRRIVETISAQEWSHRGAFHSVEK